MKRFNITVNGTAYDVTVEEVALDAPQTAQPAPVAAAPTPVAPPAQGKVNVKAPMPGNILDIKTTVGATVKAGQVLVILEAMKMENEIVAPQDGVVCAISCTKGNTVDADDILVVMD